MTRINLHKLVRCHDLVEKTEDAINNGQSRAVGNIGHTRHRINAKKTTNKQKQKHKKQKSNKNIKKILN